MFKPTTWLNIAYILPDYFDNLVRVSTNFLLLPLHDLAIIEDMLILGPTNLLMSKQRGTCFALWP